MDSPLKTPEGMWACQLCEDGLLASRTVRIKFSCFKPPSCGHLLEQPQETNTLGFVLWFHLMMTPVHFCPYRAMTLLESMSSSLVCSGCHNKTP